LLVGVVWLAWAAGALAIACGGNERLPATSEEKQVGDFPSSTLPATTPVPIPTSSRSQPEPLMPIEGPVQEVTLVAGERSREYYFEPDQIQVKPGTVRVKFFNEGERAHTFNVKNKGNDWSDMLNFDTVFHGQETTAEFTILEEGAYLFYCALYGHLDLGQFGTLTVKN
jgi:plastocyanin